MKFVLIEVRGQMLGHLWSVFIPVIAGANLQISEGWGRVVNHRRLVHKTPKIMMVPSGFQPGFDASKSPKNPAGARGASGRLKPDPSEKFSVRCWQDVSKLPRERHKRFVMGKR